MDLKKEITDFARNNGATMVGFAGVRRFDNAPKGHKPENFLEGTKTVISMGVIIPKRLFKWDGLLSESESYTDDDVRWEVESNHWYGRVGYESVNIRLEQLGFLMSIYLEERGYPSLSFPATYAHHAPIMVKVPGYFAPLSHRHAAVLAGLGEFGYNNLVITKKYGPRIRFMSVLTEAEIEEDPLVSEPICLGEKCLACIKSCGVPEEGLCAIKPITKRNGKSIFIDMPAEVDKKSCFTKYDGKARCWGRCMAVCPV